MNDPAGPATVKMEMHPAAPDAVAGEGPTRHRSAYGWAAIGTATLLPPVLYFVFLVPSRSTGHSDGKR